MTPAGPKCCIIGLFCFLQLFGCTAKLPRTVDVDGVELEQVQARLAEFFDRSCAEGVDADFKIGWQAYGKQESYPATIQSAAPSYLRLALVDPLGRPMFLLVTDSNHFTLADNRKGVAWTGGMDGEYIRKYRPEGMETGDLFYWLSGRINRQGLEIVSSRKAAEGDLYWYEGRSADPSYRQLFSLDQAACLRRHLVLDSSGKKLLDVRYSDYMAQAGECAWPGRIIFEAQQQTASFILECTKIYSLSRPETRIFQLKIPAHFKVEQVQ